MCILSSTIVPSLRRWRYSTTAGVGGWDVLMLEVLSVVIGNEQELWECCERRHRQLVLNIGGERHDRDDEGVMNPHVLMRWR